MIISQIYKDTIFSIDSASCPYTYYVKMYTPSTSLYDTVIFQGKAYCAPNASAASINMNRICENYLGMTLPDNLASITSLTEYSQTNALRRFAIYNTAGTMVEEFAFLYDWSYDSNWNGTSDNFVQSVNNNYASGMFNMVNTRLQGVTRTYNVRTRIIPTSSGNSCGEYAIYYANRYGGIDSFLFEGKCVKKDEYTRNTMKGSVLNTTNQFQTNNYHTDITTSYQLYTGWLSDTESKTFVFNVLPSNMIYLHNLTDGTIKPVYITDTSAEYKTFRNEKELVCHNITVKESHTKYSL